MLWVSASIFLLNFLTVNALPTSFLFVPTFFSCLPDRQLNELMVFNFIKKQ
jgi:hypothetical protein